MKFRQIWLAKDAGCLAGSQGFRKTKMAEIQLSGGDERFLRRPIGTLIVTPSEFTLHAGISHPCIEIIKVIVSQSRRALR
jgi:hypothetical protein